MTGGARTGSRPVVLTVSEIVDETPEARSLIFEVPAEHRSAFDHKPGQFLTLRVPGERTGPVARCYSLASSPFTGEMPKVTIKRIRDGYGSNWLCDNVKVGDRLDVLPPSGTFFPRDLDADLLLFAGGSGITPVLSILKSALVKGSGSIVLVYANRDENSVIFASELRALAAAHPERFTAVHWLESVQGLPRAGQLARLVAPYSGYQSFLCGPGPFMDAVRHALRSLEVPRTRIHAEVFTSLSGNPFELLDRQAPPPREERDSARLEVTLDGSSHLLRWPREQTLVDVMLSAGLDVPYSCREGECGSCYGKVLSGRVDMDHCEILDRDEIAEGYILGCQARPVSDDVKVEFS